MRIFNSDENIKKIVSDYDDGSENTRFDIFTGERTTFFYFLNMV